MRRNIVARSEYFRQTISDFNNGDATAIVIKYSKTDYMFYDKFFIIFVVKIGFF